MEKMNRRGTNENRLATKILPTIRPSLAFRYTIQYRIDMTLTVGTGALNSFHAAKQTHLPQPNAAELTFRLAFV